MERLPSSFRERNRTTQGFREQYARLSSDVQDVVRKACILFDSDPSHRSLRHHELKDRRSGSHRPRTCSVSPTMQYRALYVEEANHNVWYWIGSHADYKRFTGSRR